MVYYCEQCGTALPRGVTACPVCGKRFDNPVPADAEANDAGMDALLRGRTAGGSPLGQSSSPLPAWYGISPSPRPGNRRRMRVGIGVGVVALISMLALIGWGGSILWMRGPGGDAAFMQHNLAGNAASERGDFGTADEEYGRMIALRPRRVDGYLLRAINEYQEGLYIRAINDNTTALTLTHNPGIRGDLLYNRGVAYAGRGKQAQAITDFTQANQEYRQVRDPRFLATVPGRQEDDYRARAEAYWQHKDYALAIADCNTVLALSHPRPVDYGVRAKAEAALGRNSTALSDFEQALGMDPSYLDGYAGLADLAEKAHFYRQAVSAFQRGTQAEPSNALLWGNLGWFQYEAGQIPQAIVTERRAQALGPNQGWVNYNLALCYAVSGDRAQALATYALALERGSKQDREGGLGDIGKALVQHPGSALLREAQQQLERGSAGAGRMAGAPPTAAPAPLASPQPPVDPAFAALLGPETTVSGGYALRPPVGYTLTQHPLVTLDGRGIVYLWRGRIRADGTAPDIQVLISEDDGRMAAHFNAIQETQMFLAGMGDNHTHLVQSAVSVGSENNVQFAHGAWSGTGQRTGKAFEGIVYISVSPSEYIEIQSHDAVPYSRSTLSLLRASTLTFRKL